MIMTRFVLPRPVDLRRHQEPARKNTSAWDFYAFLMPSKKKKKKNDDDHLLTILFPSNTLEKKIDEAREREELSRLQFCLPSLITKLGGWFGLLRYDNGHLPSCKDACASLIMKTLTQSMYQLYIYTRRELATRPPLTCLLCS